jgi:rhodanese-related sulfurtransferase
LAAKYIDNGYKNVKALRGGVEAWKEAGFKML